MTDLSKKLYVAFSTYASSAESAAVAAINGDTRTQESSAKQMQETKTEFMELLAEVDRHVENTHLMNLLIHVIENKKESHQQPLAR